MSEVPACADQQHGLCEGAAPVHCDQLVTLFNQTFEQSHNTRLVKGGHEPIYLPADGEQPGHQIVFTRDYYASAMHEIAHWCVAGPERRLQEDYGYWYAPDGRSLEQQQLFERVEVAPQALEWMFNCAAGQRFRVSADNLAAGLGASVAFKQAIHQRVQWLCQHGVAERVEAWLAALADFYGIDLELVLRASSYRLAELD